MNPKVKEHCQSLPWCVEDPEKLGSVIAEYSTKHENFLSSWMQQWFENFQYIYGNHHFSWSRKFAVPVDRRDFLKSSTRSVSQRAQTNVSRTVYESLTSALFTRPPDWECMAADNSKSDNRRVKRLLEKLLDCKYQQLKMQKEIRAHAGALVGYGEAFFKIDFDKCAGGIKKIPRVIEEMVPVYKSLKKSADPMGLINVIVGEQNESDEQILEKRVVPVRDESGAVIYDTVYTGDVRIESLTPFEVTREMSSGGSHKAKWWQHTRIMDYDDFYKEYAEKDGRTKYFEQVIPGNFYNGTKAKILRHFMRMQYVSPNRAPTKTSDKTASFQMYSELTQSKVLVIEWYDKPTKDWPKGRLTVVVNGRCTHITEPPYYYDGVDGWHPFVESNWLSLAPSVMASGPMDDVTKKNRELNVLDSLIDTSMNRNLGSLTLIRNTSGVQPSDITGEPGLVLSVQDPQSAVAYVRDPVPLPPVVPAIRDQKKEDIFMNSGAQDAIRGESRGGTSGIQVRLQEEQERKRLTPQRLDLEDSVATAGKKLIACIQQNCTELEESTMGYLIRSAAGEFDKQDISTFLNTPITFGVDVNVISGSMQAKSEAAEQQMILDLIGGPYKDRMADASVADRVLKVLKAETLRDKSAAHRDRAQKENEMFNDVGNVGPNAVGINVPVVMFMDDDDIHIAQHEQDMVENADQLRTNLFELEARTFHIELHKCQRKEKMGELPPGSTDNFRKIYQEASGTDRVTLDEVKQKLVVKNQMDAQAKQVQTPATDNGPQPAPVRPPTPSAEMGGPPTPNAREV